MPATTADATLTTADAAERLGTTADHVVDLINSGAIEAVDIAKPGALKRRWRISEDAIQSFQNARRNRKRARPTRTTRKARQELAGDLTEYF